MDDETDLDDEEFDEDNDKDILGLRDVGRTPVESTKGVLSKVLPAVLPSLIIKFQYPGAWTCLVQTTEIHA